MEITLLSQTLVDDEVSCLKAEANPLQFRQYIALRVVAIKGSEIIHF